MSGQDIPEVWENNTFLDSAMVEKRVRSLLRKKDWKLSKRKDLEFVYIPVLKYTRDSLTREEVRDLSFLQYLERTYTSASRRKEFLLSLIIYVLDPSGNIVASSNYKYIDVYKEQIPYLQNKKEFINLVRYKKIDFMFIFATDGILFNHYLGLKGNELYGIETISDGIKVYSKEELLGEYWDRFFAQLFRNRFRPGDNKSSSDRRD